MKLDSDQQKIADFVTFGLVAGLIIGALVATQVDQHYAQFFEKDLSISYYKLTGEIVSNSLLMEICVPVPFVATASVFFAPGDATKKTRFVKTVVILVGLFMSGLTSSIATYVLKKVVGRPRPVALYNCDYLGYQTAVQSGNFTAYNSLAVFGRVGSVANCWVQDQTSDMWSSFPSGHATLSFATLAYAFFALRLTLKIDGRLHYGWRNILAYSPIVLCTWISASRVIDMRHHVDDVLAGALIGFVCAALSWLHTNAVMQSVFKLCGVESEPLSHHSEDDVDV